MEPVKIDLGDFEFIEKHKDCLYGGRVFKCRTPYEQSSHLWCNGREWEIQKGSDDDKGKRIWIRKACKYSAPVK